MEDTMVKFLKEKTVVDVLRQGFGMKFLHTSEERNRVRRALAEACMGIRKITRVDLNPLDEPRAKVRLWTSKDPNKNFSHSISFDKNLSVLVT
jgi:hypothetical protein